MSRFDHSEWDRYVDSELEEAAKAQLNALDRTVKGSAPYEKCPIQPVEFIEKNGLPFLEGEIIKRLISAWLIKDSDRDEAITELEKAKHEIDLILQLRFGE